MNSEIESKLREFISESPVREEFSQVLGYLKELGLGDKITVDEVHKEGEEKTFSVYFTIKLDDFDIDGRVGYDLFGGDNITHELCWDDENYRLMYSVGQMKNMLTLLIKRRGMPMYGFKDLKEYKEFQRSRDFIPLS